jgi:hypothetical protein
MGTVKLYGTYWCAGEHWEVDDVNGQYEFTLDMSKDGVSLTNPDWVPYTDAEYPSEIDKFVDTDSKFYMFKDPNGLFTVVVVYPERN